MQPSRAMISTDYEIVRSLGTRFTKLPNLLVASLLMLACSPPKQEAGAAQPQAKPSWRVELAKIFQGPDEFILDVMPVDDFVAVIRTDVWVRPGQPRIGWTKSCRVKAAVLDARNGGVLVSRVLFPDQDGDACDVRPSTAIGEKGIYVAYGQTLVRTDWALKTQASADLSKISVTELSQPGGAHWEVFYTERDGQLVLACSAGKALYWLDPATLSTQFIKQLVAPIRKLGLSGDKVIYLPLTKTGADLRSLFVETQESQQSSAVPAEVLMAVAGDGCFMAVANDERFISDRRGQVCWREPSPRMVAFGPGQPPRVVGS
jgi:hypothetical protein